MTDLAIEREILIEAPAEVVWRVITVGEEPGPGNSQLVEFTLIPEGAERTRLRVTESGRELRAWPEQERQRYADEHQEGWGDFLDRLVTVVAKNQPA